MGSVNGLELLLLGHRLIRLGEDALPPSHFRQLSRGARTVVVDVFSHPGSSIKEITERTGLPQSLVSATVAKLRDAGIMATEPDPADRRRTLVAPAPGVAERGQRLAGETTVDGVLARAMGMEADEVKDIVTQLDTLARRLAPLDP
ncbi:unnamed protein product [[Actinomadura] parvosata subsp. kistnae]|nr:unnamed protein product [Actinomadura parvosata subsp. kistnae]